MAYVKTDAQHYANIGAAIRSKNGLTTKYKPSQMPAAIRAISGIDDTITEFSQVNDAASAYLAASSGYENDPNYTTQVITQYEDDTDATQEKPKGKRLTLSSAGTIFFMDEDTGESWSGTVSAGSYTVYNLTPGHIWRWWLKNSSGKTVQSGRLRPTGDLRMIYLNGPHNWRDIGGWGCDGGKVRYGLVYRGAQLSHNQGVIASAADVQRLRNLGIKYEIDLRTRGQTAGPDEIVDTADDLNASVIGDDVYYLKYPYSDASYVAIASLSGSYAAQTKALMRQIVDNVIHGEPTYIHCQAGADRTGVIAYLIEGVLGVSQADMDRDFELTSFYPSYSRTRLDSNWRALVGHLNTISGTTLRDKMVNWYLQAGIPLDDINAFRAALIDGDPEILNPGDYEVRYSVTRNLGSGITASNNTQSVDHDASYSVTLTPNLANNVAIKAVKVLMAGVDITENVVSLTPYTPPVATTYSIVNNLTHVTTSNASASISEGNAYVATLTADEHYNLSSVTVKMGGVNITSTAYSSGTISIPNVTGNIVITATATQAVRTNQLAASVDSDGTAYNGGTGYKSGYRLNSNGVEAAQSGAYVTGFMPITQGQTVTLENIQLPGNSSVTNHGYCYIALYDASKELIFSNYSKDVMAQSGNNAVIDSNNYVTEFTLNRWLSSSQDISGARFFRFSALAIDGTSAVYVE